MNRIQQLIGDDLVRGLEAISALRVVSPPGSDRDQTHCLFTPMHYERNYAYPLIVWLHGPHDDECQITRVMPLVSLRNYVGVGVRGTLPSSSGSGGYRWSQELRHFALAEERVLSAVSAARRWFNVAPSRIYLAGYECGGTMALRIALAQPDKFAGALSLNGPFPTSVRPLARLQATRRLPLFLATCRDSRGYPQAQVCQHLRLFHAAALSVDLRQYPCGDELTTTMLSDVDRWIMGHVAEQSSVPADTPRPRSAGR